MRVQSFLPSLFPHSLLWFGEDFSQGLGQAPCQVSQWPYWMLWWMPPASRSRSPIPHTCRSPTRSPVDIERPVTVITDQPLNSLAQDLPQPNLGLFPLQAFSTSPDKALVPESSSLELNDFKTYKELLRSMTASLSIQMELVEENTHKQTNLREGKGPREETDAFYFLCLFISVSLGLEAAADLTRVSRIAYYLTWISLALPYLSGTCSISYMPGSPSSQINGC